MVAALLLAAGSTGADGLPGDVADRATEPIVAAPETVEVEADAPTPPKTPAQSAGDPAAAGASGTAASSTAGDPQSVFRIERNKNRNQVHYGIRLDAACRPQGDEPVHNYWLRLEEGPGITKPVTFFQQVGYGVQEQSAGGEGVRVVLRALPQRPIAIETAREGERCLAHAYIEIDGARARFDHAYVFAVEGLVRPTVEYVELFGTRADGSPVHERIKVD